MTLRIDTQSGLHGQVIAYAQAGAESIELTTGIVILRLDQAQDLPRSYSVHAVHEDADGIFYGFNGEYDLTIEDAYREFDRRTVYAKRLAAAH